jgi:Bacterial regulatory helix-turn-helix protein, lysR family
MVRGQNILAAVGGGPPHLLVYIDAIARHGSIRKAAEALNVAPSALNRQVLDLEQDLGSALFERLPRGVRLTAAGEMFLAYARQAISELKALELPRPPLSSSLGQSDLMFSAADVFPAHAHGKRGVPIPSANENPSRQPSFTQRSTSERVFWPALSLHSCRTAPPKAAWSPTDLAKCTH